MIRHADIAVYDPDGKLQLVVSVKTKTGASQKWVIQRRQKLLSHAVMPDAPYFLLALPDYFYLWMHASSAGEQAPPDYVIQVTETLASYIDDLSLSLNDVTEYDLEMLIASWLEHLVNGEIEIDPHDEALTWLFDSGLFAAIQNGSVAIEATV
ncbi:MAG: hypothetical protein HC837_13840 [Chloroflexaceae bacterium]|nr:hypothetical protein [Chloroflexaceae bacterium]